MKATEFERTEAAARELRQRMGDQPFGADTVRIAVEIARVKDVDLDELLDTQERYYP